MSHKSGKQSPGSPRQLDGQEREKIRRQDRKLELARRHDSVIVLAQAEGSRYLADLLKRSDHLCFQLEKKIVNALPVSEIESARALLKKRDEIAAILADHNVLVEKMMGFGHREPIRVKDHA